MLTTETNAEEGSFSATSRGAGLFFFCASEDANAPGDEIGSGERLLKRLDLSMGSRQGGLVSILSPRPPEGFRFSDDIPAPCIFLTLDPLRLGSDQGVAHVVG